MNSIGSGRQEMISHRLFSSSNVVSRKRLHDRLMLINRRIESTWSVRSQHPDSVDLIVELTQNCVDPTVASCGYQAFVEPDIQPKRIIKAT